MLHGLGLAEHLVIAYSHKAPGLSLHCDAAAPKDCQGLTPRHPVVLHYFVGAFAFPLPQHAGN